jgi:hypothetical protein
MTSHALSGWAGGSIDEQSFLNMQQTPFGFDWAEG